ncbi:MAG: hypothetical protein ABIT91_23825 [Gemmatimonadaceae bacterium]
MRGAPLFTDGATSSPYGLAFAAVLLAGFDMAAFLTRVSVFAIGILESAAGGFDIVVGAFVDVGPFVIADGAFAIPAAFAMPP